MKEKPNHADRQSIYSYQDKITLLIYSTVFIVLIGSAGYIARSVIFRPWTIRAEISASSIDQSIYVFGGRDVEGSSMDEILHIDTIKKSLRRSGNLPVPCAYTCSVMINDKIYIIGGYSQNRSKDHIIMFNPKTKTSKIIGHLPRPLAFGAAITWNSKIYYMGGWNDTALSSDIIEIEPETGDAKKIGTLDRPREYFSAVVYKNKIYIIGGEDNQFNNINDILEIDPVSWSVIRKTTFPYCSTNTSITLLNGKIFAISGWDFRSKNQIIEITPTPENIILTDIVQLPQPLSNPIMVSDQKALYVIGGVGDDTGRQLGFFQINPPNEEVHRIKLSSFVWW